LQLLQASLLLWLASFNSQYENIWIHKLIDSIPSETICNQRVPPSNVNKDQSCNVSGCKIRHLHIPRPQVLGLISTSVICAQYACVVNIFTV
jgi:hypothetical protein